MTLRQALLGGAVSLAMVSPANAEMKPTLSFSGVTGLIDMPSGDQQSDGMFTFAFSHFGPVNRQTVTFQFSPRWSGSFRYSGVRNWDNVVASSFSTYYDRSFDLRYQLTKEGSYVPAITIGLQDFIGTSLSQAEYIAATKTFGGKLKLTAGLGWGRLGSYGAIGAPFGHRKPVDIGNGGTTHFGNLFKGDVAPFAGIEWKVSDRLTFKAEYSSDAYAEEAGIRKTFDRKTPFNFGLAYQVTGGIELGLYSLYGSEVGATLNIAINPYHSLYGGMVGPGPIPVAARPAASGWTSDWVNDKGSQAALLAQTQKILSHDGITLQSMAVTAGAVVVRIDSVQLDNAPQAIGRTARALAATMPPSVESFEIVPLKKGVPVSKVVIKRSDLEALEFAPGQDVQMWQKTQVLPVSAAEVAGAVVPANPAPRFTWHLAPFIETTLFNPDQPIDIRPEMRLSASYRLAPGLLLSGSVTKRIVNQTTKIRTGPDTGLPPVRTDASKYVAYGDPGIRTLSLAWYAKPAPNLYTRVSAGYLEDMFGGISSEVLWMPIGKPYALGAEVDMVQQRDYNEMFGFRDYRVGVGFVSGYYAFQNGVNAELDVGKFLAGDYGARFTLDRSFANGWKIGAFATFTNASFAQFGEGSFDKGIVLEVPLTWFFGKPTQQVAHSVLRPILRNGGAMLDVDGRLYDTMRDYRQQDLDFTWGRFWR